MRRKVLGLEIHDFRGIDALELRFADDAGRPLDLVVLAGANGCGKTAALEAIALASGRSDLITLDGLDMTDPAARAGQIRFGAAAARIAVTVTDPGDAGVLEVRIEEKQWQARGTLDPDVSALEYFSAARESRRGERGADPGTRESQRLVDLERRLVNAYYRSMRTSKAGRHTSAPFVKLQRWWQRFDPAGRRLDVIPVDNNPGSNNSVVLCEPYLEWPEDVTSLAMARRLAPTRGDIPRMVTLQSLSSGQAALLAFAGPLVFRDEPADIVLIDEPEQHMHVQWQRLLLPALRELCPDTQFIVATHSEEILDSVLSYERFILVEDQDPRSGATREDDDP